MKVDDRTEELFHVMGHAPPVSHSSSLSKELGETNIVLPPLPESSSPFFSSSSSSTSSSSSSSSSPSNPSFESTTESIIASLAELHSVLTARHSSFYSTYSTNSTSLLSSFPSSSSSSSSSSWNSTTLPSVLSLLSQTTRRLELLRSSLPPPSSSPHPSHLLQHRRSAVAALFQVLDPLASLFESARSLSSRPALLAQSNGLANRFTSSTTSGKTKSASRESRDLVRGLLAGDEEGRLREEGGEMGEEEVREVEEFEEIFMGGGRKRREEEVEEGSGEEGGGEEGGGEESRHDSASSKPFSFKVAPSLLPSSPSSARTAVIPASLPPSSSPSSSPSSGNQAFSRSLVLEGGVLLASLHSELDSAEEIEQKMTAITSLLSSFSSLVQEQSEQVHRIEEATVKAKEEVEKGGEELLVAKKRMEGSKYWIPMFNVFMGILLMFLHWMNP